MVKHRCLQAWTSTRNGIRRMRVEHSRQRPGQVVLHCRCSMWTIMLTLGHSTHFGAGCTHRLRLSWEPGGETRTQVNASATSVIYWASRRAQNASSCLGSDLSLWNVHKRGHFEGNCGGPTGAQPCVSPLCDITRHTTVGLSGRLPQPLAPVGAGHTVVPEAIGRRPMRRKSCINFW